MRPGRHAALSSAPWRLVASALAIAGACSMVVWADRSQQADPGASSGPSATTTAPDPAPTPQARRKAPPAAPAPVRVTIPAIDVSSSLVRLGKQPNDEVEVPQDPLLAGWYALGTAPGAVGSAVILGHVDSTDGPAVFYRLSQVTVGDRVEVDLVDGSTAVFVVRSVRTYANGEFPARLVYTSHGRRELNVVTCGGTYDASRGGYQANVVVNARWVAGAPA